jgi:hypothetical protein
MAAPPPAVVLAFGTAYYAAYVLGVAVWVALAAAVGLAASRKGYSFWLFMALSVLLSWFIVGLVVVVLPRRAGQQR